ncbi:hypothetical protein I4F81_008093 [Pyropia yezoensis]|uniref:Uncharacterized protein n=1 Tax=Pyropia yezoensis TaxID=2788 RepID=A0ACC3C724_PYRYE|nr:hypothetical protein I4F81_008093 [Neopyropia yezoensis]
MTLDGRIATDAGDARWVSGPPARGVVQQLRGGVDAIVVGGNTVRLDDPQLTLREDPRGSGSGGADPLLGGGLPPSVPMVSVEVVGQAPLDAGGVATALGARGCMSVLWECGGGLAGAAMAAGVVQRVVAFVAPKVVGGGVYGPVGGFGLTAMADALPLRDVRVGLVGEDVMVVGEVGATEPKGDMGV